MKNKEKREIIHIEPTALKINKLKVCAYCRVSTDSSDQLNSYLNQINYYGNLIKEKENWELVDIYADEGISGQSINKREDFKRMIEDCKKGKIDRILTKSISRFARNTKEAIEIIRLLKELGISINFEKENIDTENLQGEVLLTSFTCFAQEEAISISQNSRKGAIMRMKNGTHYVKAPYGYIAENKELKIDEDKAKIIKMIFNEYIKGKGMKAISDMLNDKKIPSPQNKLWEINTVRGVLTNEKYTGDVRFQKTYKDENIPPKTHINNGQAPMYYIKNNHKSIIDKNDFEKAKEIMKFRDVLKSEPKDRILSKKIKCAMCGRKYNYKQSKTSENHWRCTTKVKAKCNMTQITEHEINIAFIRFYHKLKDNYKYIFIPMLKDLETIENNKYKENKNIEKINKEIAKLTEQGYKLNKLINEGILDESLFIKQKDEINQKIIQLKIDKNNHISDDKDEIIEQTKKIINTLENAPEFITEITEDLINGIIEEIIAYKYEIGFKLINKIEVKEKINANRRDKNV